MSYWKKAGDEFNTCPRCGASNDGSGDDDPPFVLCEFLGKHIFVTCMECQVYWYVGYGLLTSYEQHLFNGHFDEEIGGPQNRETDIVAHDHAVIGVLESYKEVDSDGEFTGLSYGRFLDALSGLVLRRLTGFA